MILIKYTIRTYLKDTGQVAIRVRWNSKKNEVAFFTGVWVDSTKWDYDFCRAKKGSIHSVRGQHYTCAQINGEIAEYKEEFTTCFDRCMTSNTDNATKIHIFLQNCDRVGEEKKGIFIP